MQSGDSKVEPNIIGEMFERGFTLVDVPNADGLLEDISRLSSLVHRGTQIDETGAIQNGTFGLVLDWRAETDNRAVCVVNVNNGFSFLRITGSFLSEFTRIYGLTRNTPDKLDSFANHFVGDETRLIPRTFDYFGNVSQLMPYPLEESSVVLKSQVELLAELAQKSFALASAMGIQDVFSPRNINNFYIEFPLYLPGSQVDSTIANAPVHQHDQTDETVLSVQLSDDVDTFVAGLEVDSLEQVEQGKGKCIAMGPRVFHGPVPTDHVRKSVIFVATRHARDDMHRGLGKLADTAGWLPTSIQDRISFTSGTQLSKPNLTELGMGR